METRRLWGHSTYGVARRIRQEPLSSYLRVYGTRTAASRPANQFRGVGDRRPVFPGDSRWFLYNHEWGRQAGSSVCGFGMASSQPLGTEGVGRNRRDWTCHEVWSHDGDSVLYHGRHVGGRDFIGRIRIQSDETMEIPLPAGWDQYGHYDALSPACLISDGYFRPGGPDPWIVARG